MLVMHGVASDAWMKQGLDLSYREFIRLKQSKGIKSLSFNVQNNAYRYFLRRRHINHHYQSDKGHTVIQYITIPVCQTSMYQRNRYVSVHEIQTVLLLKQKEHIVTVKSPVWYQTHRKLFQLIY